MHLSFLNIVAPANDRFRTFLEDCNFDPKDTLN